MQASAFWRFSLAFYARPGVAQACLELQDQAEVDVNVMLYLLFLASQGRQTDRGTIKQIEEVAAPWRKSVVIPLRSVRRELKAAIGVFETTLTASLRRQVKGIELAAERIQQETLERLVPAASIPVAGTDCTALARTNLAVYGQCLGSLPAEPLEIIFNVFACVTGPRDRA